MTVAWNYSPKEFIKVYRKLMEWEWYTDVNTTKLFIHCLLRANWKAGKWQGINYLPGEFITSLPSLAEESGLTVRQVRTSLDKLISTGELTSKTTDSVTGKKLSKNRIIAVNNWDKHQGSDRQNDSQSDSHVDSQIDRTATGKRQASDSRYKNNKNNKKEKKKKEGPAALSPDEDDSEGINLWDDFDGEVIQ